MVIGRHVLFQERVIGGSTPVIPPDAIALWSGTLGTIPANWTLCDGTGGTPNLVARFLRGAPAATEPGTINGSDSHTHASMTSTGSHTHTAQNQGHDHDVNSAGDHNHATTPFPKTPAATGPQQYLNRIGILAGAHQHTTSSEDHSHTMDSPANHTHTISADDGRPPFYEIAFIQAGAGAAVAANLIIIWTGLLADIPAGWSLCDSGGGRPDLRATFIRGVNTDITDPGAVGGADTHGHTETALPAHNHSMDASGTHSHSFTLYTWTHNHNTNLTDDTDASVKRQTDAGAGNHTHAASNSIGSHNHNGMGNDGGHAHTVIVTSSIPVYYDVAYIINDGGAITIPLNGILVWTGLLANIPSEYNQCDGGGGRPELRGKFLRGAGIGADPGGEGGNDTHTHTDQDAGAHAGHSMVNTGAHQHADTDNIGTHTHAMASLTIPRNAAYTFGETTIAAGVHLHTYNSENNHTHSLTNPGDHDHNAWSTDDGRPAYYEVAFIQKA